VSPAPTKISVNGCELTYQETGNGLPVVFVHGALSDSRCWSAQFAAFGASYRSITYSRRYHHPNAPMPPHSPDPWDVHVEDLAVFLRAINACPAHLVGNSQGAFINLMLAARYPELVRSLVLAEAPVVSLYLSHPPRLREVLKFLVTHPLTALTNLHFGATTIAPAQRAFAQGRDDAALRVFVKGALGTLTFDELDAPRQAQILANLAPLRAFMLGEGFPQLTESMVRSVTCPVLLVTGSLSPSFIVHLTDRLMDLLPNAEQITIDAASHLAHEEQPASFNAAVAGFLKRNDSA
jgi:pimeloyl-ACP methyl ester carboxylesterase